MIAAAGFSSYRDAVRVSLWENYGKSRLYVEIAGFKGERSYLDLKDADDLEFAFNSPEAVKKFAAWLETLMQPKQESGSFIQWLSDKSEAEQNMLLDR